MTAPLTFSRPQSACSATLSFDAAQAMLAAHAVPLGTQQVPLATAGGRVLAEDVRARIDAPRYDAAAMDGFAISESDFASGLRRFRVTRASFPGAPSTGEIAPGEAVRIMTGAAVPAGASRIIVLEQTSTDRDNILISSPDSVRPHIRTRASDMAKGDIVLSAGRMLDPRALVVAAAADIESIVAWRQPRVHIIASGDELVASGTAAVTSWKIPYSLSQALLLMTRQWGGQPVGATLVRDDAASLAAVAEAALCDCDLLVMVGGASKGDHDFAKIGLQPFGLELVFADVAIKPGKPVWYGRVGSPHVLGLPGNPTAAMTIARLFLAPLLTSLGGRGTGAALGWNHAKMLAPFAANGQREAFLCAEWTEQGVRMIERQTASAQHLLAMSDVVVRRAACAPALEIGDTIAILHF